MISTEAAQAQLGRLSWMPGYPGDTVRLNALARALVESARSLGHAAATVDELGKRGFCPTADQITDQAWASLSGGERHACAICYRAVPYVPASGGSRCRVANQREKAEARAGTCNGGNVRG